MESFYRIEFICFKDQRLKQCMVLKFDSKVTDVDCVNISQTILLLTVIEAGRLKAYSFVLPSNEIDPNTTYTLIPTIESAQHRNKYCMVRILPYGQKDIIACSDFNCNIHLFKLKSDSCDPFAKPSQVIFNSHAKLITDMVFLMIPIPDASNPNYV